MPSGFSVTTASRKTIVSAASRIVSASSFGVFWRLAPSTSEIMRSKKPSPGLHVMRILSSSESTRVPPVTALRSPPASRMTGADSPVMADSSTVAAPKIISPSAGMISLVRTTMTSPLRSESASTISIFSSSAILFALVRVRVARSDFACALPRPSATASAKLANNTVNQSQIAICKTNPVWPGERKISTVLMAAPTIVTNMTGFLTINRGSSLRNVSPSAGTRILGSKIETDLVAIKLKQVSFQHQKMFDNRTERERGQKGQRADENHRADEQQHEGQIGHGKSSGAGRNNFFLRERSGEREQRHNHSEASEQHVKAERRVPPRRICVQSGERAAVVACAGCVGVKHFAQAMRALIGQTRSSPIAHAGPRGETKDDERENHEREQNHFYVVGFDFFAEIFRRASDH